MWGLYIYIYRTVKMVTNARKEHIGLFFRLRTDPSRGSQMFLDAMRR
jgi:hypothetical protein